MKSFEGGKTMTSPSTLTETTETQNTKGSHKFLAGVVLTLGAAVVLVLLFGHRGLYQTFRFRQEGLHLEQENARLASENARLARTIDRLQHDPEMIQDLIRRELNFVKSNEVIFQLPPEGRENSPNPSPRAGSPPLSQPPAAPVSKDEPERRSWQSLEGAPKKAAPQ